MRNFFTIWSRELTACFLSPIAYVTMVVFLFASGLTFLTGVEKNVGTTEELSPILFASILFWLTIAAAVICMRLFAEEKRTGTIESLLTAPVTEAQVVLGKYAGALTFLTVVVTPAVGFVFILEHLSPGIDLLDVDAGAILGGCLVLFLISAFFVSIGLLISLLTSNQIAAAISILCALLTVLLFGWFISFLPGSSKEVVDYLSATTHIEDFSRGSVDSRPIVLCLSSTVFMLFTAVRVLESRRW